MKKNFTSTLVMLGLLLGLSAWYVFYEEQYRSKQKTTEDSEKKFIALTPDEIVEFKIEKLINPPAEGSTEAIAHPSYEIIEFKRTGKDWNIISPVQTQGDNVAVEALLKAASEAKQERVVEEAPKNLTTYGLQTPLLKLSVKKDSSLPPQGVEIGANTPVAYAVYAKTNNSSTVFKTTRTLKSSLDKDLLALRDKNVLKIHRDGLVEVEIENEKENIVLKKESGSGKADWVLSRENIPADSLEWSKTLNSLLELKATKIAAEKDANLVRYGLNKPLSKVTFTTTDKNRTTLLIGKAAGLVFAQRVGAETIFEVDKTIEDKTLTPSIQYRDKHLAKFDRYSVSKLTIEKAGESLELKKADNDSWSLGGDKVSSVDKTQVDNLLTKIQDTLITKYLEKAPKAQAPKGKVKLTLFESKNNTDKEIINLTFSELPGNTILGTRSNIPFKFEISKDDFDRLNVSKKDLLKHEEENKEANKQNKKS